MDSKPSYPTRELSALFLTIFLSGCGQSIDTTVRPILPDLPYEITSPCVDPGVASDALVALTETRVAFAACRRKHSDAVAFYRDVKGRIQ